ncbi:MAG: TIGR02391 family protein [Candidatus Promineifilaceae bacterium]
MRGLTLPVDLFLNECPTSPVYLDGSVWEMFVDWLEPASATDNQRIALTTQGDLNIYMFKAQLDAVDGPDRTRDARIRAAGIQIIPQKARGRLMPSDEVFLEEVQRIYFRNVPGARRQAELLLLARRHSSQPDRAVKIISQHRSFERIPDVDLYYLYIQALIGEAEPPASFDFYQDFKIHSAIENATHNDLDNANHAIPVLAAYAAFEMFVQQQTGLATDGDSLMNSALNPFTRRSQPACNRNPRVPSIQLNPLTNTSPRGTQMNEQEGNYLIASGLTRTVRNPLSHQGGLQSQYAQTRFTDKNAVLKYLTLFSLLCERVDEGQLP